MLGMRPFIEDEVIAGYGWFDEEIADRLLVADAEMSLCDTARPRRISGALNRCAGQVGTVEITLAIQFSEANIDACVGPQPAIDFAPIGANRVDGANILVFRASIEIIDTRPHIRKRHAQRADRTCRRFPAERKAQAAAVKAGSRIGALHRAEPKLLCPAATVSAGLHERISGLRMDDRIGALRQYFKQATRIGRQHLAIKIIEALLRACGVKRIADARVVIIGLEHRVIGRLGAQHTSLGKCPVPHLKRNRSVGRVGDDLRVVEIWHVAQLQHGLPDQRAGRARGLDHGECLRGQKLTVEREADLGAA